MITYDTVHRSGQPSPKSSLDCDHDTQMQGRVIGPWTHTTWSDVKRTTGPALASAAGAGSSCLRLAASTGPASGVAVHSPRSLVLNAIVLFNTRYLECRTIRPIFGAAGTAPDIRRPLRRARNPAGARVIAS
jgi:hypothetical protein